MDGVVRIGLHLLCRTFFIKMGAGPPRNRVFRPMANPANQPRCRFYAHRRTMKGKPEIARASNREELLQRSLSRGSLIRAVEMFRRGKRNILHHIALPSNRAFAIENVG